MKKTLLIIAAAAALLAVACKKDKVDTKKPSITWESNPGFAQVEMTNDLDATVTVSAPGKIQDLKLVLNLGVNNNLLNQYIKIESNKSKGGSNPVLDLVADSSSANLLGGLGMRVGSSLNEREEVKLDLRKILERILLGQPIDNNSTFTIEVRVTDLSGNTVSKTAKFHYTAAPAISWAENPGFEDISLDAAAKDCKIAVWAPGKIEKLTVILGEAPAPSLQTYVKNRTTDGLNASGEVVIDLIGDAKVAESFKGWFPAGDAVRGKEQATLDFGFMYGIKYDLEPSTNVFSIHVEDKNGKETYQRIRFKKN